jgi:hypothetical protein
MKLLKTFVLIAATALLATGCIKPPKVPSMKEIKPNETAWVIPLDAQSQSGQAKFNSVEFLNQHKVATKRIWIDKVEKPIGRFSWEIEWIDAVRVIAVDRSLVTREWTDNSQTGTSSGNQGIPVNTKDNIGLTIGLTITASIDEDDASTYLYYHGEKTLAEVTDQNIRSFAVAELNRQVSSLTLVDFQQQQAQIYSTLFKDTAAYYKTKGVTIQYLGNAEGWHFSHKEIQDSINKSFITQQDNKTAEMEQQAQKTRNATAVLVNQNDNAIKVATAQAEVDAATKLENAKEAAAFRNTLQIQLLSAQAKMAMATKWDGKMPANIIPSTSPLLLNLGDESAPAPAK